MSDVRLPLSICKELRDQEAQKAELLQRASTIVGSPVTANFQVEQSYAALASNATAQVQIAQSTLSYLQHVVAALEKGYSDHW